MGIYIGQSIPVDLSSHRAIDHRDWHEKIDEEVKGDGAGNAPYPASCLSE